jgi:Tfp pilus assembly protein PilX
MNLLLKGPSRSRGAALIIVLAFVVLLTGLGVAYLSRTTSDRQVAHSSLNQTSADQLAQSATDNIIGDLRQEITNGSGSPSPTASPVSLFVPTSNANMVPMRNNTSAAIPNLIRRSLRSESTLWPDSAVGPAIGSRASAVNSTNPADASANGRSIGLARWNSHYLIPKANTADGGSDPITTGYNAPNYWAPDWVFVTAAGATPAPAPANVIGRYAYAIYDEGGLLDMNAAGYPSPTTILQYGRKGSLAFADLTGLSSYGLSTTAIDNAVGWRNYASARASGNLNPPSANLSFNTNSTNTYYNFILSDPNYIQLTNYFTGSPVTYFTKSFLTTSQAPTFNSQTDQALTARQELIKLRSAVVGAGISFSNALQYLGTLSREALANVPQWSPTAPDSTNPNFQTLLVTGSFTRNDGATASVGDPYVSKRFLLQRLNWLTYRGPSATVANGGTRNAVPTSAPAMGDPDYDLWLLTRSDVDSIRFGLTSAFLQQGTAANVLKYFGLVWDATNERWNYTGPSGGSLASSIATLGTLTGTREPDFFELLQAGIISSTLGGAFSSDPALPRVPCDVASPTCGQQSKMFHILAIGANLIAQSRADSYPVRIACNVGGTTMEAVGMARLPCLSSLAACPIGGTGLTGGVNWLLIPNLWDPFRDTWDLTEQNAGNTGNKPLSTPGYLRPPVRITVKGNITFAAANVSQSGSVDPGSIFPLQPPVSTGNINATLTLATGNNAFGRDGLLNAMRLGVNDIGGTLPGLFDPTQSPSLVAAQWNRVHPPTNDGFPYRTDDYIVFRLSLPGALILPTNIILGQKPVLILQPGFQVSLDYQSPTNSTKWYSYSFLQGINDSGNPPITWITAGPLGPLTIGTNYSEYGTNVALPPPPSALPTVINLGPLPVGTPTPWNDVTGALAHAPMFAKADPRSPRYNSMIGVVNVANPPLGFNSAGVIGSIWPSQYATPPSMSPSAFPTPTPTPNPNPVTLGDNALAGNSSNPYSETSGDTWRPVMMNRPFRSVGEMGYAFRDQPFRTLSFSSANSPDAGLLDLFTTNDYSDASGMRGGVISLNSRQAPALAGVLTNTIRREDTPRSSGGAPSPSPSPLASPAANNVAASLTSFTISTPQVNRAGLATLIANETGLGPTVPKTQRESIARALGETAQTRTWNLLIDVIAQTGKYAPGTSSVTQANKFTVDGEQRYWVHVAVDRFTGRVIEKQIEIVNE